ncbi:CLUMA_CG009749, isoform A [Clunio marinus]|uniref:CLUMA_CG009749, isoform A n=1 Tax=Clunio marinus TaxID=568069 RepID=A0A1J1I9B9_9DIPT|nr:CLUMA_CG009749, isoform A [Clunio marinus]
MLRKDISRILLDDVTLNNLMDYSTFQFIHNKNPVVHKFCLMLITFDHRWIEYSTEEEKLNI